MTFDPAEHTIAELRDRWIDGDEPASPDVLRKLRHDRRKGARRIYRRLKRRRQRRREARERLDELLSHERRLWSAGLRHVAGVDEAGVGPLAGPVVAAAVVVPPGTEIPHVDDSKRLGPDLREELAERIREAATGVGIGSADVEEIASLNVYRAALRAMRRAVEDLPVRPERILVDAREIPDLEVPQETVDGGDGAHFCIAAASIVAKTHRDRLMVELDSEYPEYGFARHKGYTTSGHEEALRRHGACAVHRRSYTFVREVCGELSDRFYELQEELGRIDGGDGLARFERQLEEHRDRLADEEYQKLRSALNRRSKTE